MKKSDNLGPWYAVLNCLTSFLAVQLVTSGHKTLKHCVSTGYFKTLILGVSGLLAIMAVRAKSAVILHILNTYTYHSIREVQMKRSI